MNTIITAPPHELLISFIEQAKEFAGGKEQKQLVRNLAQETVDLISFAEGTGYWRTLLAEFLQDKIDALKPDAQNTIEAQCYEQGEQAAFQSVLKLIGGDEK